MGTLAHVSDKTIGRTPKKCRQAESEGTMGHPVGGQNATVMATMRDVLDVYHRLTDLNRPLACLHEVSKQPIKETRTPIPATPGQPACVDYKHERNGTATCSCCSPRSKAGVISP
jgi:hypothetical protein